MCITANQVCKLGLDKKPKRQNAAGLWNLSAHDIPIFIVEQYHGLEMVGLALAWFGI